MTKPNPYELVEVTHHFNGGLYTKEIKIPAGVIFGKHIHSFDHQSILVSGAAIITVDGVSKSYMGPTILNIKAGSEHMVECITDVVWLCQHVTDKCDPDTIDMELINE